MAKRILKGSWEGKYESRDEVCPKCETNVPIGHTLPIDEVKGCFRCQTSHIKKEEKDD
jgi:hypothetical protein